MSKVVESSYHTVDETISAVERLLSEGRVMSNIVIVTNNDNYSDIRNRTLVKVDKVSADGDLSMWEKFKEMFTDVDQEVALEHYGIDKQTALRYNNVLKSGSYVILVEEIHEIPIRHNLEDGPKELGKSTKEQKNTKPIGQSGSGAKIVSDTSDASGQQAVYTDKDASLVDQNINFLDEQYAGKKENPADPNAGFQKARLKKPVGQSGSGVRVNKDTTLPDGEKAMSSFEDRQLNDDTVQEDNQRFSSDKKPDLTNNERKPIENPLQGKPKDGTEFQPEDAPETAVEGSPDLPRFDGSSITGQPVVDPLQDEEWK